MNDLIVICKQIIKIIIAFIYGNYKYIVSSSYSDMLATEKYVFIFFSADYNNLGDIAITVAQEEFIRRVIGNEYNIIKVNESETYDVAKKMRRLPIENVLITMIGGGNNGSLYEFIEAPRRFLLWKFKKYKIVSFPQSITFENNIKSKPYKWAFSYCCNRCKNLILTAREKESYYMYEKIQNSDVILVPDIVFSFNNFSKELKRYNDVTFILRDDKEKNLDKDIQNKIIEVVKNNFQCSYFWDTCDIQYISGESKNIVNDYLNKLSTVSLAITDRLHGMILCYISKTPCIVMGNNNGKILSTYETWLKDQNYIKFYDPSDGLEKLSELIYELKELNKIEYVNLNQNFNTLEIVLREDKGKCKK